MDYCIRHIIVGDGQGKLVEGCITLEAAHEYAGKKILKYLFGHPFKIAPSVVDGVIFEARRIIREDYAMSDLVIKIQKRAIFLDHLGYKSALKAPHTLESIVRYLPPQSHSRLAAEAKVTIRGDCEAQFEHLSDYIGRRARIADSGLGYLALDSIRTKKTSTTKLQYGT